ncbi:MAG: hypothetical protein GF329_04780 [Candidatus Lokiarchaeota archaeon]|nr:hypothetical protein [Candidatus Lokiarchaeota archaeon]
MSKFSRINLLEYYIKMLRAGKKTDIEVLNNRELKEISGCKLYIAPLEYVLLGKLMFIGRIEDIPESELLEYQDILDFLIIYNSNKDDVNEDLLTRKAKNLGLENTLNKLKSIKV